MLAAPLDLLFPWQSYLGKLIQRSLLRIAYLSHKQKEAMHRMARRKHAQARCTIMKNSAARRNVNEWYLASRTFDFPRLYDRAGSHYFTPLDISLYHAGWWCLAQATVTVPRVMARMEPRVQMAA